MLGWWVLGISTLVLIPGKGLINNVSQISSLLHLQTAIYQALLSEAQGQLRTKTIHSEILWALNPTNNVRVTISGIIGLLIILHLQITEAIRRYGVSDVSTTLIAIRVDLSNTPDIQRRMCDIVQGSIVPFEALKQMTDWSTIKKVCHCRIIRYQQV